jgi:phenylpropionate dioxygenase-like ring-hydroxylating dioxygenase large terminal subunit
MLDRLRNLLAGDRRPSAPAATAPDFAHARNRRQKVRSAGMDPDYWYPVEYDRAIAPGQVVSVTFWKQPIAVFRAEGGELRAIDDRCAHRQLKLSLGCVKDDQLVCPYHGWCYGGDGRVVAIPHELFGREMPQMRVRSYPIQVRYGLIWIFPGDPNLSETRRIPEIPELEAAPKDRWACVPIDATWRAHHSMIIDNVSDFTHEWLHRKYRPFADAKLLHSETIGDKVHVTYATKVGGGDITGLFIDREAIDTNKMDLCYEYPYQWSNTDNKIKHWCFVLPIDERTTRAFFLFYFDQFKVPFLPLRFPRWLMNPIIRVANVLHIGPLLAQDGMACEAEQEGYDRYYDEPIAELNPAVGLFQQLTIRKWEEHLAKARSSGRAVEKTTPPVAS